MTIDPPRRILIIDADIHKRLATELKYRGRRAVALSELGLAHALDPDLLDALPMAVQD